MFAWLEPALAWFLAAATQWRRGADGRVTGLDYQGAEAAARLAGLEVGAEDFTWLRVLEAETLAWLAETRPGPRDRRH